MTEAILLEHARVLTPFEELHEPVLVVDGRVAEVGGGAAGATAKRLDLLGNWLVPGFVDVHVHGGGGAQFNSGSIEECRAAARFHAQHGTTALLATTVAAPRDALIDAVRSIARAAEASEDSGAELLGCHLEGPFLITERCGAMDPRYLRAPDADELGALIEAGAGCVKMVAVAPELPGAIELIRVAVREGLVAAVGHSNANYRESDAAFDAGARHAIHLFNATAPFHHRDPGLIGAVLGREEVSCELIADGHHVHPAALRLACALKGSAGAVLVTDAVSAAGMPDGSYHLGEAEIRVAGGRAVLADGDSLAGSTLTMDAAVRGAVEMMGLPLTDAVRMATATPAGVVGMEDQIGRIAPGYRADLAVLDPDLAVLATIRGGRLIHGSADQWS